MAVSGLSKNNSLKEIMIIIKLKGGLGNQMFQYALGRKLSLKTGKKFQLDKTDYENDTFRSYGLGVFNIIENFTNTEKNSKLDPSKKKNTLVKRLKRIIEFRILKNYHIGWEPYFLKKILSKIEGGRDVYLDGYWQSYKYTEEARDILSNDFSLKNPLEKTHSELLKQMTSTNSVALSVRRTDYLLPKVLKSIGICSANYYNQAIEFIASKIKNPYFFIITDDLDWVKENVDFKDYPVFYVSELRKDNSIDYYQELAIMSKCKHNIIANSSFSWWPAWLNQNPEKIVIAPDVWFTDGSIKIDDIIPPTWIKLPRD